MAIWAAGLTVKHAGIARTIVAADKMLIEKMI